MTPMSFFLNLAPLRTVIYYTCRGIVYNKYLSPTAGVILIIIGVISFCIFGICSYKLCCVLTSIINFEIILFY
jgi:hypothetical protein